MTVNMPVVCLGEVCKHCTQLSIKTIMVDIHDDELLDCQNILKCKYFEKCESLMKESNPSRNKQAP